MQQRTPLIAENTNRNGCCLVILIIGIVLVGGFVLASSVATIGQGSRYPPLFFTSFWVAVLLLLFFFATRRARLQRLLKQQVHPAIIVSNHPLRMGEHFMLECVIPPQSETEIIAGTLTCVMQEWAAYETGMGTRRSTTTVTHVFSTGVVQPIPHIAATGGVPYTCRWNTMIPLTMMHTFKASNNSIQWYIVFEAQVRMRRRTRKYVTRFHLTVLPIVGV